MVRFKFLATLMLGLAATSGLRAQNFSLSDTVTEYHMKGTYYHDRFEGRKTASGDIFDQNLFTAAHKKIKMGTLVMVTNRGTGERIIVKINDRCPKDGVLDMTHRAANGIGIKGSQIITLRILPDSYEEQWASQDPLYDSVYSRLSATDREEPSPSTRQRIETVERTVETRPAVADPQFDEEQGIEYNLLMATVKNHGEAYDFIQRLPYHYQEKAIIDTLAGESNYQVIIDVRLPKKQALMLSRSMRHQFPKCTITTSR